MRYREQADEISALLHEKLGVRGRDLETRLRRAGRLLPRHVRRDVALLVEAARFQASPRLARLVDDGAVQKAYGAILRHLEAIDPARRRMDRLIGLASTNAFNLLVVFALLVAVLRWRGFL